MISKLKYRCAIAFKSLLLLAGFGAFSGVQANHILGGEVTYTHLGGKKYKFSTALYRNCDDCEFNTSGCHNITTLEIYASPDVLNYALKLGSIPLTKTSRKDITPLCKSASSKCVGGNFTLGIEEWIFEGYVDFDTINPDYCQFEVAIRVQTRADVYNANVVEDFYNYARLNTCNNIKNTSPQFRAPVYYLLPENQSFTYNPLAFDADGDSLSYELVNANAGWKTKTTYTGSYTGAKPLDVYCPTNCNINRKTWPLEGIGIEPETGWMGFTPTQNNQTCFLVLQVTEWRKIGGSRVKVGVTRRDMQVKVVSVGNNVPKVVSSQLSYFACAGNDFMMDFSVIDPVYNSIKDSISLFAYSDLPDFVVEKVKGSAKNQFDAFFTVPVKKSQIRDQPYYLTIMAVDNSCPLKAVTYQTVEIIVTGIPDKASVLEFVKCNQVSFTSKVSGSDLKHSWFLMDQGNMLDSRMGLKGDFFVPKPGKYYIIHQILNAHTGCLSEAKDSIDVPYFSPIKEQINWPSTVCSNEPVELNASFTGGVGPFNYFWNQTLGSASQSFSLPNDSLIKLEIIDSKGCEMEFLKKIAVFKRAQIAVTDSAMCLPAAEFWINLNQRLQVSPAMQADQLNINYFGTDGTLNKINAQHWFYPKASTNHLFEYSYKDENTCSYKGSFQINVVSPVPTGIVNPAAICNNDGQLDLNKATGCLLNDGRWYSISEAKAVISPYFQPSVGPGTFTVGYEKDYSGCLIRDTTVVQVKKAPDVQIQQPLTNYYCENSSPIVLLAKPLNGAWSNNAGMDANGNFQPVLLIGKGLNMATYKYKVTNLSNQCSAYDSITLYANKLASFTTKPQYDICEGDELLLKPEPKNLSALKLVGDFTHMTLKRLGDDFLMGMGNVTELTSQKLQWQLQGLQGCPDQNVDMLIRIKPRPEYKVLPYPAVGCAPLNTELRVGVTNPKATPDQYFWYEGTQWILGAATRTVNLITAGDYVFSSKTALEGCESEPLQVTVTVLPTPNASFKINPESATIPSDFSHAAFESNSRCVVPYTLYWEFEKGSPANSSKSQVEVDFPKDTGLYLVKLTASTEKGCSSVYSRSIRVMPGLQFYVPNSFTPDGKGPADNELFKVVMDSTKSFRMTIRNRWGEIVFASENPKEAWNGNYLGKEATPGVYIWELEATTVYGIYVRKAGPVSLIR